MRQLSNGGDVSPTPTLDGSHTRTPGSKPDSSGEKDHVAVPGQAYFGSGKNDEYDEKIGTTVTRGTQTGQGPDVGVVTGQAPQPGYAGVFGGVAPSGADAEEGRIAPRSYDEELEREKERAKKAPDPWSVRFEPGERSNPKVSHASPPGQMS